MVYVFDLGLMEVFDHPTVSTLVHPWVIGDFFPSNHFLNEPSLGLIASYGYSELIAVCSCILCSWRCASFCCFWQEILGDTRSDSSLASCYTFSSPDSYSNCTFAPDPFYPISWEYSNVQRNFDPFDNVCIFSPAVFLNGTYILCLWV